MSYVVSFCFRHQFEFFNAGCVFNRVVHSWKENRGTDDTYESEKFELQLSQPPKIREFEGPRVEYKLQRDKRYIWVELSKNNYIWLGDFNLIVKVRNNAFQWPRLEAFM